jgi:hypothetical protein
METRTVAGRIQSKATLRNICWLTIAPAFALVTLIVSDSPVDYYKYLPLPARLVVVPFWLSVSASVVTVIAARPSRKEAVTSAVVAALVLLPNAQAAAVFTIWWIRGFTP